jgi:hypothetical protein
LAHQNRNADRADVRALAAHVGTSDYDKSGISRKIDVVRNKRRSFDGFDARMPTLDELELSTSGGSKNGPYIGSGGTGGYMSK